MQGDNSEQNTGRDINVKVVISSLKGSSCAISHTPSATPTIILDLLEINTKTLCGRAKIRPIRARHSDAVPEQTAFVRDNL